ncbi:MAG: hypothetical protein FVQ81_14505 [Candidatus Glassbacteria bacterium]|nr:hypothetical protein [Candidatus Glassbacteria bacterium]
MRKLTAWLLFAIAAHAVPALAQTQVKVGSGMLIDDNIFRNYSGQGDVIFMPYVALGYSATLTDNDNLYFAYDGDFYLFNELGHRDFSVHAIGADYNHIWPESKMLLSAGTRFEGRINPEDYSYYNYSSGGVYLNLKRYLADNLLMYARYNLNGRSFKEFPEFNYAEQVGSLRLNYSLPSRTTLSVSATYSYKDYTQAVAVLDSNYISPDDVLDNLQGLPGQGMGRGRGGLMSSRMQDFLDQQVAANPEGFYVYRYGSEKFPSTSQFVLGLSVAQNLAEGTGLMLGYYGRANPSNRNRFLANIGESVLNNEELFDDHYSYVGHEGKVQLKQMLPGESMLTMLLTARTRRYSGRPALDEEGNALPSAESRLDKALVFSVLFTRRLSLGTFSMLENFQLSLQAGVGANNSNDAYYDYDSAWFSMGIEKNF